MSNYFFKSGKAGCYSFVCSFLARSSASISACDLGARCFSSILGFSAEFGSQLASSDRLANGLLVSAFLGSALVSNASGSG